MWIMLFNPFNNPPKKTHLIINDDIVNDFFIGLLNGFCNMVNIWPYYNGINIGPILSIGPNRGNKSSID